MQDAMARIVTLSVLLVVAACPGDDDPCPPSIMEGEECQIELLVCPFPGGQCTGASATLCTCENQPGGFFWHCEIKTCRCTCFCEKVAVNSCESLGCTQATDPCPSTGRAKEICELLCSDAGTPDSGVDGPPADAREDALHDAGVDAPPDLGPDTMPDSAVDQMLDAGTDAPQDAGG